MKQIILIGDSIRIGYQPTVQKELDSLAQVWGPEDNGRTSEKVLRSLNEWVIERQPDLVHINCGLHDLRREFGALDTQVPLAHYRSNVENILRQIREHTRAQIIWATTTPVNQQWHHTNRNADRFEADVLSYNLTATEICNRLNIPINDLFSVMMHAGRDNYMKEEGLHFNPAGYELLGHAVAEKIRAYL